MDDDLAAQLFDLNARLAILEIKAGVFVGSTADRLTAEAHFKRRQQRLDPFPSDAFASDSILTPEQRARLHGG
jgi:hypothetical protein